MLKSQFLQTLAFTAMFVVIGASASDLSAQGGGSCSGCDECGPDKVTAGDGNDILRLDEACATGECEEAIPCGGALLDTKRIDYLAQLIREHNTTEIVSFARTRPKVVEFAANRNSIVVWSPCSNGNTLIALIPVGKEYATALATAFAEMKVMRGSLAAASDFRIRF